jgi:hypothetical protein
MKQKPAAGEAKEGGSQRFKTRWRRKGEGVGVVVVVISPCYARSGKDQTKGGHTLTHFSTKPVLCLSPAILYCIVYTPITPEHVAASRRINI